MKRSPHFNIFVGYDERQDLAYRVCKNSIEQHASRPVTVYPLKHRELRDIGLLTREWKIKSDGHTIDLGDERPFSTQFAFSRFLTPAYAKYLGCRSTDISIFVDSDFVFLTDVYRLLEEVDVKAKPVWCVKHDYNTAHVIKMDNQSQVNYNKKLWSSFMVFGDWVIPTNDVNTKPGSWLHGFEWLDSPDQIGSLYEGWNFIPDHSEPRTWEKGIYAIHYTEGTPMMKPGCRYAEVFNSHLRDVLYDSLMHPETLN